MFPIRNVKGECIGFGGRVLGDEKPKYLNSPETPGLQQGPRALRPVRGAQRPARARLRAGDRGLHGRGGAGAAGLSRTRWRRWAPPARRTTCRSCSASPTAWSSASTATPPAAARRARRWTAPCPMPPTCARQVPVPAGRARPGQLHPRVRRRGLRALRAARPTPLSRFLIEAAREGCDLATAEGRAHLASNARPAVDALPEGALKRQLLGEIADLAQLGAQRTAASCGAWRRAAGARRPEAAASAPEARYRRAPPTAPARARRIKPKPIALAELRGPCRPAELAGLGTAQPRRPPPAVRAAAAARRPVLLARQPATTNTAPQPWAALQLALARTAVRRAGDRLVAIDDMQPSGRRDDFEEIGERELRRAMTGHPPDAVKAEWSAPASCRHRSRNGPPRAAQPQAAGLAGSAKTRRQGLKFPRTPV